ncbi:hypothetical protein AX14_010570 [Amanita brunnescens Koide BX004]|nr:hypothetical protein AX14_010570 [Amanita brunnescens Koide BX004]
MYIAVLLPPLRCFHLFTRRLRCTASAKFTTSRRFTHRPAPRAEKAELTAALVAALLIGVTRCVTSMSGSPVRHTRPEPRPDLALLRDALREPMLPARPPAARLADSLRRPPSLISHPCVSLSLNTPLPSPPIVFAHAPPKSSSIDTLKRISVRSASSSAPVSPADSSQVTWSWSQFVSEYRQASRDERAESVEEEQRKKYKSTKNPIVFCHGLLGFDSVTIGPPIAPLQVGYWRGIKEVLEANGTEVLITRVPATSSYVDRAKVLKEKISQAYAGRSIHLIAHSMGGLDCRYLAAHLTDRDFRILSITTIATPHRGSSFADHFLETVGRQRLPQVLSLLDLLPNGGGDGKAFECLTVEHMRQFNQDTPDVPDIKYFSWGAMYRPGLIDTWKYPHSVILEKEGENDGLVSVESAKWGTYLGTLEHVNHLDLVGWLNLARYKWAEVMGREIKFSPATFYLGNVDMLARSVEGQTDEEEPSHEQPGDQERLQMEENLAKGAEAASKTTQT